MTNRQAKKIYPLFFEEGGINNHLYFDTGKKKKHCKMIYISPHDFFFFKKKSWISDLEKTRHVFIGHRCPIFQFCLKAPHI